MMYRFLTSQDGNDSVPLGSLVLLNDALPGYLPCDGMTTYSSGMILNDLLTQTLQTGPWRVNEGIGACASSGAIALMISSGTIKRTTDGLTWSTVAVLPTAPDNYYWQALTWDGAKFIAFAGASTVGLTGIYYSTSVDGITWSAYGTVQAPMSGSTSTSGGFVAASNVTTGQSLLWCGTLGTCYRSANGTVWSGATGIDGGSNLSVGIVGYGSNCFMVEVADQLSPRTYKSTDGGATFTKVSFPVGASKLTPLIGTPGGTVIGVVKSAVSGSQPMLVRSTDGGTTWLGVRGSPMPLFQQAFTLTPAASCAVGSTLYVENLQSTDDGQTWTRRGVPIPIGFTSSTWWITTAFAIGGSLWAAIRWAGGTAAILASGAKSGIGMVPYKPGYFVKVS